MFYLLILLTFVAIATANDRIVMTMGPLRQSLIAKIEALPEVEGSVIYSEVAALIRIEGSEYPVTDLLDAAGVMYEVEIEKSYSFDVEENLDRIDQRNFPLDGGPFNPVSGGNGLGDGVLIYIVDSGIRVSHEEFEWPDDPSINRAANAYTVSGSPSDEPCSYHGTAVASVAAGKTLGAAQKASVHSVKVALDSGANKSPQDCPITLASLLEGLLWIIANGTSPAIINLSLAGGRSVCVDLLVKAIREQGNMVVDAAGNNNMPDGACDLSPARSVYSTTVAATFIDGNNDKRSSFSNYGDCVDYFAPGEMITMAGATGNTVTRVGSGTSFSAPLVAGGLAIEQSHRALLGLSVTADDVEAALRARAVTNNVDGSGSTDYYFLHVGADAGHLVPSLAVLMFINA